MYLCSQLYRKISSLCQDSQSVPEQPTRLTVKCYSRCVSRENLLESDVNATGYSSCDASQCNLTKMIDRKQYDHEMSSQESLIDQPSKHALSMSESHLEQINVYARETAVGTQKESVEIRPSTLRESIGNGAVHRKHSEHSNGLVREENKPAPTSDFIPSTPKLHRMRRLPKDDNTHFFGPTSSSVTLQHAQTIADISALSLRQLKLRNRSQLSRQWRLRSEEAFSVEMSTAENRTPLHYTDRHRTSVDLAHAPVETTRVDDETHGRAVVSVAYSSRNNVLTLLLENIVGLPVKGASTSSVCTATASYSTVVQLCLLPDQRPLKPCPTGGHSLNPRFNTEWNANVKYKQLQKMTMRIGVFEQHRSDQREAVGFALLPLDGMVGETPERYIISLQRRWQPGGTSGQLLISTAYSPSEQQLCVVIHKAQQLTITSLSNNRSSVVKVSLRCCGEKVCTKRSPPMPFTTSSDSKNRRQRCEYQVVFTFVVPLGFVDDTRLVCTAIETRGRSLGKDTNIGRVIIGPYRRQDSYRDTHWGRTLDQPFTQITQWHNLYR